MKYFFVLGINPTLSLAELAAVFNNGEFSLAQKNIAIIETEEYLNANIIKKIGGTIKFGIIHNELASLTPKDILRSATFAVPEKSDGKFYFGISFYGKAKIYPAKSRVAGIPHQAELFHRVNIKTLGMEFKKRLLQSGINSRWVISREPTLSSVVVEQNKLTTAQGAEIVIVQFDKKLFLGKTIAVQPFKELSFRDYGRPARDDYSGMLPPKLAQIMINLSGAKPADTILDPFCGSGTIITEAALMGYKNLIGTDKSDRAITDTKKNIDWTEKNYSTADVKYKILNADATQISKQIQPNSVDAIITEPYLGPQSGLFDVKKIIRELENLYSNSLKEFHKILKPGGKIVMIWPVFQGKHSTFIYPNTSGFKTINPFPKNLQKNIFLKITNRGSIVYGRDGQKIWREIVVLKK